MLFRSQGNGKDKDVRVINTPAEAVPVTLNGTGTVRGDVNVINTPTVNVGSMPGVNVVNTPTVKVDNTQPLRVVESSAREPFQSRIALADTIGGTGITGFTIPAGKRLVVEFVSAWMSKPGGVFITIGEDGPGINLPVQTYLKNTGGGIADRFAASQEARLYATGTVRVISEVNSGLGGDHFGALTVVGYLIPTP